MLNGLCRSDGRREVAAGDRVLAGRVVPNSVRSDADGARLGDFEPGGTSGVRDERASGDQRGVEVADHEATSRAVRDRVLE